MRRRWRNGAPVSPDDDRIRAAFHGSVAKTTDQAASDIGVMVVSDSLSYGDVSDATEFRRITGRLGQTTVFSTMFRQLRQQR